MIGIIGNMSGGKSYSAVRDMLERFASGHICVTNIILNLEACADFIGCTVEQLRPFYWRIVDDDVATLGPQEVHASDYESWPAGSMRGSPTYDADLVYIYLDEVSSIFDAMTSGASDSIKKVAAWARHTEKRGQMLFLIMQFENELHKRLRVHITEYIFCKNMSRVKFPLFRTFLPKSVFSFVSQIHLYPDGETPMGYPNLVALDERVFRCYQTAQIVVGSSAVFRPPESDISGDVDVASGVFQLYSFLFVVTLILTFWGFYGGSV